MVISMNFLVTDYKIDSDSGSDCVVLEDCIMQEDRPSTAGSKILENFISPLNATVVDRLTAAGIKIRGKVKMNEFGLSKITADRPDTLSGAVEAVVSGFSEAALCNDFSGTIRRQAAENNLYYIHPTYGTVSRYGLIPSICSMDQIGVLCSDLKRGFQILSILAGNDPKDGAMFPEQSYTYQPEANRSAAGNKIRIGIPDQIVPMANLHNQDMIRDLSEHFETVSIDLPHFNVYAQVMYILASAEISNNINRYDGIKFGYRTENYKNLNDLYLNSRTEGFDLEAKLAAIMGSMVLSKEYYIPYYEKAMKIRRLIKESLNFDEYDLIAVPSLPDADLYRQSALYALAPLAGLPTISFPWKGGAIQLIANVKNENGLFAAWEVAHGI